MSKMKLVEKSEFDAFLRAYPRPLARHATMIFEPPLISYNDFERAPYWPDSVVASFTASDPRGSAEGNYRVLSDINSPVEDDGERDTDAPLKDSNGVVLVEGDAVRCRWGYGSKNTTFYGTTYDENGECWETDRILIRDKGTKYEKYSFERCHNRARGIEMYKV